MSEPTLSESTGVSDSGIIAYFCNNRVAANVILVLLFAGGIVAVNMTNLESFPEYDPRIVRIEVPYPGASPTEVEEDILKRIEESLVGTIGVTRVVSRALEGRAIVDAEMESFADDVDTLDAVRTAVERIEDFPPRNADQPEVTRIEVTRNVLTLAVSSPTLDPYQLRHEAELLRDDLLLLPSVAIVKLVGTKNQEIRIEVDEETLTQYGFTLRDVVATVRKASVNVTGGELRTQSGDIVMSTLAKGTHAEDFARIVIVSRPDGSLIRLGDIATVSDSLLESDVAATVDGIPTVFVHVRGTADTSQREASSEVRDFLAQYSRPHSVSMSVWDDETWAVEGRMYTIVRNGLIGLALVFITLLLVFDLRTAKWVTLGVPAVFLSALVLFPLLDLNVNLIVLFAFFVLIGIVVDDAIIVAESVMTFREAGYSPAEAALAGTKEVIAPVSIGVLALIIAFAVLLPLDGLIGQLLVGIPIVAVVVLAISILEAALVLPGHLAKAGYVSAWPLSEAQNRVQTWFEQKMQTRIIPMISWSIRNPYLPPAVVVASVIVAASLLLTRVVEYDVAFSPIDDMDVQVDLLLHANARPEDIRASAERAAELAANIDAEVEGSVIDATAISIGEYLPRERVSGVELHANSANVASVKVRLNPSVDRVISVADFTHRWQRKLVEIPGVHAVTVAHSNEIAGQLSFALTHPDAHVVQSAAEDFQEMLAHRDGVTNVSNSTAIGKRSFEVVLNDSGRASGLTAASVATQLRNSFYGAEAQRIQRGREELLVMVRYPEDRRTRYADLMNELVFLPNGREQVPLFAIAELKESNTFADHMRIDGRSAVVVTADIGRTGASIGSAAKIATELLPQLQRRYPGVHIELHGQSKDAARAASILQISIPIGLLVLYVLISSFLRSFVQPLLALAGIPMAFVGAVVGHFVLGYVFSFASILGFIAVSGVIVSDTILLLHRFNQIMADSQTPAIAAITAATRQRARAVLLTSVTTALSLTPMLFSGSEAIQFLIPMVVSITFGLVFSGIGLLFFLPSVTMIAEITKDFLTRAPAKAATS
ncbi:MAG: efflux RND transporter permease subunit [Gammaproteobacteria bacterium]|nr:efflux RND transporter permease subunit [Gammaproteobacteria bacterium]